MPLAARLLVALGAVALLVTAAVGYSARNVARREVERGFEDRIDAAVLAVREQLVWDAAELGRSLAPLCVDGGPLDRATAELDRGGGDMGRLSPELVAAVQRLVAAQREGLGLDELLVVAGDGHLLAGAEPGQAGRRRPELGARVRGELPSPRIVQWEGRRALESGCARRHGAAVLGLLAYRELGPLLRRVGNAYGVSLVATTDGPASSVDATAVRRPIRVAEIPGLDLTATASRDGIAQELGHIDRSIALSGAAALLLAIAVAVFVASSLSRPIVELAAQARAVVTGKPRPVRARGGRELSELAASFNRSIAELTAMRRRLAVSERIAARREIARQVAHEIKNPLAPIRAAVETLRRLRARSSPDFDEYFEEATATVLTEVHRISEIVTEFTKFARLAPPKFARVDLPATARSVAALHDGKGITGAPRVAIEHERLPEVLADRDQIVQVLQNLVQNGIDAARAADPPPAFAEVTVRLELASPKSVRVTVTDNGPGVDSAVRDRLFEPYASTKPGGTGLGLAIAQRIVFEHGGELRLVAEHEPGACFEFVLPVDGPPLPERANRSDDE